MHKNKPSRIAIDGPAASGKTSIGMRLAQELGYLFFDTGVMYRAVTWAVFVRGLLPNDEKSVSNLANQIVIDVLPPQVNDGRTSEVFVDDENVSWAIRSLQVDEYVSIVSAYQGVREALIAQQRRIGLRGNVVMVGRDIGTVILPEADLKIYLDASSEMRAKRRFQELIERGGNGTYHEILHSMQERDEIDTHRAINPLQPAIDAIIIQTDSLSLEETLGRIRSLI